MKKNVLKKFAAAALAAATVMSSMSVMAFAADAADAAAGTEKKGSVTITKYMGDTTQETLKAGEYTGERPDGKEDKLLKNVEFAYVKVGERVQVDTATSNSSQTEIQYKVTDENFLDAIGLEKTAVNKNFTQETLNAKVSNSTYKTKVINFVNTYKGDNKKSTDEKGEASFEGLDLNALYVFAETDATKAVLASDGKTEVNVTKVSVPFLVSLPFTGKNGETVKDLKVYPKNSTGEDTIDKKIVEGTNEKVSTTANIGDTINYKVTYSIPVGENGLKSLVVTDTMSKGLTFANGVEVKNETTIVDPKNYNVVPSTNADGITTTTITFSENYCKTLKENTTQNF